MKEKTIGQGTQVIAVGNTSVLKALMRVAACQGCAPAASRPFSSVLVEALGAEKAATEYLMSEAARCPNCSRPLFENTMVRCHDEANDHTAYDIRELDLNWDETNLVLIDEDLLAEAQACLSGCEYCVANTETTFDYVLDAVTDYDPTVTEYVLCGPAICPRCGHEVTEKTFVAA